jgi:hypothetical protein
MPIGLSESLGLANFRCKLLLDGILIFFNGRVCAKYSYKLEYVWGEEMRLGSLKIVLKMCLCSFSVVINLALFYEWLG